MNLQVTMVLQQNFISELASVLLDVYNSCGKLGTMSVTSKAGIISVIYKKVIKKIFQTKDPDTTILKNWLQKTLDTIIGEKKSATIKKEEQLYILFLLFVT